jgi:hypothetical protein
VVPSLAALARVLAALPLVVSATCAASTAGHRAATSRHPLVLGADISWPNCPKGEGIKHRRTKGEPMPGPDASFVIVGLTNGPGFHPNPCLADQLRWVRRHGRWLGGYALTTYPTSRQVQAYGGLHAAAYAEATYNIDTIAHVGMSVPMIWVDVEPYPFWPWSSSHRANRAVIRTVIRRYRDAGHRVGIYTYANGWREVVGHWRLPKIPTWSTAGQGTRHQARRMCTLGPSGGTTWVAQWYTTDQDFDLLCAAAPAKSKVFTAPPG